MAKTVRYLGSEGTAQAAGVQLGDNTILDVLNQGLMHVDEAR